MASSDDSRPRGRGRPRRKKSSKQGTTVCPALKSQCTAADKSNEDEDAVKEDARAVLWELISAVETKIDGEKETDTQYGNGKGRRGAKRRVSYDIDFKATVLKDLKRGRTRPVDVAEKHKIHKSLVTKWQKQEKEIMEAASKDHKKALKRRRPKSTKKKRDKA